MLMSRLQTRTCFLHRLALCSLVLGLALLGCDPKDAAKQNASEQTGTSQSTTPALPDLSGPHNVAVIKVKDLGEIRFELLPELAPNTVANFEKLANEGFYDGTSFHRVIPGFMIQGGDPNTKNKNPNDDGHGGPGYSIKAEFNALPHTRGVVSMARRGDPDSAGSQFFIVVADSSHLDNQYTAFGRVLSGIEVVDRIVTVPRDLYMRYGPQDRPLENVIVESIRIESSMAQQPPKP